MFNILYYWPALALSPTSAACGANSIAPLALAVPDMDGRLLGLHQELHARSSCFWVHILGIPLCRSPAKALIGVSKIDSDSANW